MAVIIKFRRGTALEWSEADPILFDGEAGFEKDSGQLKIGDGEKRWSELTYFIPGGGAGSTEPVTAANTTTAGIVELATNTETAAGTDATRAVTPASLRSVTGNPETDLVALYTAAKS